MDKRGSVLPVVLVVTLVAGVLGMALIQRSISSGATGAWNRDHLVLHLLAESAAEELYLALQKQSNTPADPVFEALRQPVAAGAARVELRGLELTNLPGDLRDQEKALGGTLEVKTTAALRKLSGLSGDALEKGGLVELEVVAQLKRNRKLAATERVKMTRAFKVSRVTAPRPFDQVGLYVAQTTRADLKAYRGRPAFALAAGGPHTLVDLMTHRGAEGFQGQPKTLDPVVAKALGTLSKKALAQRAQFVVQSGAELAQLFASRLADGGALTGVVLVTGTDPVKLSVSRFRGKCLLALSGPVELKDVTLEDRDRDSLTIVSPVRTLVSARTLEASVLSLGTAPDALVFRERCQVHGAVVAGRFPHTSGLGVHEFAEVQFAAAPELASGAAPEAAPDANLLSRYVVAVSPYPLAEEHARDKEDWGTW